jgi:hypothetical protein
MATSTRMKGTMRQTTTRTTTRTVTSRAKARTTRTRTIVLGSLAALVVLAAGIAAPAGADVGATIIERCTHGKSLSGFSQQAYRKALQEVTAEVNEYSECATLIRKAELAAAGRSTSAASGGGGPSALTANVAPPTPAEQHALQQVAHSSAGATPVRVGAQTVVPGVVHANIASAVNSLPTPLLALLTFMLTIALLMLGRAVRDRVGANRHD